MVRIENQTKYSTRCLRSFVIRSIRFEERDPKVESWGFRFHRQNRYHGGCTGHVYSTRRITIGIPDKPNKIDLAQTICHEIHHTTTRWGILKHHKDFPDYLMRTRKNKGDLERWFGWANEIELEEKKPKLKPQVTQESKVVAKIICIQDHIKSWEKKEKRAKNALKKYKGKLRYYEKRKAALRQG